MARRTWQKLAARYYGPFLILQWIGDVAYKLDLPEGAKVHPVFHVSQLKKVVGDRAVQPELPPQMTDNLELKLVPEVVLGVRQGHKEQGQMMEALIKWKGSPAFDSTWEDFENIQGMFPEFDLEDKISLLGRGNVTHTPLQFTYHMRKKKGPQDHGKQPAIGEDSTNDVSQ